MIKQIAISFSKIVYLSLVKLFSLRRRPKNNKIVFLLSFPSTSTYVLDALVERYGNRLVVCYTSNAQETIKRFNQERIDCYPLQSFYILCTRIIPIIKASQMIICDNYFAFLGGMSFDEQTKVVQIWHANGAIKKFGLQAQYAKKATAKDQQRYQKVYDTFTHFVVSSPTMAEIFAESYNIDPIFLKFGYPMTDYYFNRNEKNILKEKNILSKGTNKKIALYVPTYRENDYELPLDFEQIEEQIGDEWVFYIHAHPHDKKLKSLAKKYPSYFIDEMQHDLKNLFIVADCLITDYSSVPFEFSLANPNGKIIYFCYDYELYDDLVGIQEACKDTLDSSIVKTPAGLFEEIMSSEKQDLVDFNAKWNTFVSGNAMNYLFEWIDEQYEN